MDDPAHSPASSGSPASTVPDDLPLQPLEPLQQEPLQLSRPSQPPDPPKHFPSSWPSLPFPPLLLLIDDADTLAYIDPPPEPSKSTSVLPRSKQSVPHRIRSAPLLETNSPYFRKLFAPRVQARNIKRRGFERGLPDGIKYVIDLTPPSEDEEAVIFVTELSCPQGIRAWTQFARRWNLPHHCVGGQDEDLSQDSASPQAYATPSLGFNNSDKVPSPDVNCSNKVATIEKQLPAEYSARRHRIGIEHILQALQGVQPAVDTPCKFWTFFTLAHLFEIATLPIICDFILAWVYHSTNTRLIETQPEVTYKIACGTRCASLCRESFAILVGEEALLLLAHSHEPPLLKKPKRTLHGRIRESLDDTEIQRIEYASKSFMEYVLSQFILLTGVEMPWFFQLPTIQTLRKYEFKNAEEKSVIDSLITMLQDFVRGRIILKLIEAGESTPTVELSGTDDMYPSPAYAAAYGRMPYIARIMCKTFWRKLLFESFTGVCIGQAPVTNPSIADFGYHLPALRNQTEAKIKTVYQTRLERLIMEFNDLRGVPLQSGSSNGEGSGDPAVSKQENKDPWKNEDPWKEGENSCLPEVYTSILPRVKARADFLKAFTEEVRLHVFPVASRMTQPGKTSMSHEIADTVVGLTDEEFKYLPLWAGGNDDGTGGVFNDQEIPVPETGGFSRPGPHIHTNSNTSSCGSSSIVGPSEFESTVQGASHRPTDGYQSIDVMSLDSGFEIQSCNETQARPDLLPPQGSEDNLSIILESSANEDEDENPFDSASDSSGTVVMGHLGSSSGLSDFEDLTMDSDDGSVN